LLLDVTWSLVEKRLAEFAVANGPIAMGPADSTLSRFGLVSQGELTTLGDSYYTARFIREDNDATDAVLAQALKQDPTVNAVCEILWRFHELPKSGVLSALRRLEKGATDERLVRLLEVMSRAKLIVYNRNRPKVRALHNPVQLVPPLEAASRERATGHLISPEIPFGNLLALRDLIRSASKYLYWYEQHMPAKVLEVLYRELVAGQVSDVRLLSGPENVDAALVGDFKRFRAEMASSRSIATEWAVLTRREAANHHGRFFLSNALARNIPPLNSILKGSTDEILPSKVLASDFEVWWSQAAEITSFLSHVKAVA
jgi:hypothetical protein